MVCLKVSFVIDCAYKELGGYRLFSSEIVALLIYYLTDKMLGSLRIDFQTVYNL